MRLEKFIGELILDEEYQMPTNLIELLKNNGMRLYHNSANPNRIEIVEILAEESTRYPVINGILPLVVDAWTHDDWEHMRNWPWTEISDEDGFVVSAWKNKGAECNTPCKIVLYPTPISAG